MTNTRDTIRAGLWPALADTDRPLTTVELADRLAAGVPNGPVHVLQVLCEQERAGRVRRVGRGDPPGRGGSRPVCWALTPRGLLLGLVVPAERQVLFAPRAEGGGR